MFVDGGAAVNIMPYVMLRKLGKNQDDLTKTDMMLKDFGRVLSPVLGALCVDLTIGSKTLPTTFFIINGKVSYSLLLGWDWIHANCCIPSTMHQCLIQWVDDAIEIVSADSSFSVASAEAHIVSYDRMNCLSGQAWEKDFFRMADYEVTSVKSGGSSDESCSMKGVADCSIGRIL